MRLSASLYLCATLAGSNILLAAPQDTPVNGRPFRLSGVDWIRSPSAPPFQAVELQLRVDKNGAVISAQAVDGPESFRRQAIDLARTWRYKPSQRPGQAVPVFYQDVVLILPPERPDCSSEPVPVIHNWQSVVITLQRTRCFGSCSSYEIRINGSGQVVVKEYFPLTRERSGQVSRHTLEDLLEVFRKSNYFALCPRYITEVTDSSTYKTSLSIDGLKKSVVDYDGLWVGMPPYVRDLEDAIDDAVKDIPVVSASTAPTK